MSARAEASNFKPHEEFADHSFKRWNELVGDLPDIRLDKVLQTRRALRQRLYDSDEILEETIRRLGNEVGILCRRSPRTDSR